MKKKLSLLLAALMLVSMVPATVSASTTNKISRVPTIAVDNAITNVFLSIDNVNGDINAPGPKGESLVFELDLKGAEWDAAYANDADVSRNGFVDPNDALIKFYNGTDEILNVNYTATIRRLSDTRIIVTIPTLGNTELIRIEMAAVATDEGEATVTIDKLNSAVTANEYSIAIVTGSATKTTSDGTVDMAESAIQLKSIIITEVTPRSISSENGATIRLKLSSGFAFNKNNNRPRLVVATGGFAGPVFGEFDGDDVVTFELGGRADASNEIAKLVIENLWVENDSAKSGSVAEITVSGANVDKTSLEVANYIEYGISFTAENKTLPVMYSGSIDLEGDNETLKVIFAENVADSWSPNRKTTFTFPTGVKVVEVDVKKVEKIWYGSGGAVTASGLQGMMMDGISDDHTEISISGLRTDDAEKAKFEVVFTLSISPSFKGDVEVMVGGAALAEDLTATVATVVAPIIVTAETNDLSIDYRQVPVTDILVEEVVPGAMSDDHLTILSMDRIQFESGVKHEILEGDITITEVTRPAGATNTIEINVKSETSKTPAKIKISGLTVYLDRTLPVGGYNLRLARGGLATWNVNDRELNIKATSNMFHSATNTKAIEDNSPLFNVPVVTVVPGYVKVITAGRDQDDSTFTTKIIVTIGATEMTVGDTKKVLDVPAYIKDGYTMMPVRAVVEALSGRATVTWNDDTKTCSIIFGSRAISMTVGKKTMTINGVEFAMNAVPEITNDRTFIPLRDLGLALGLNDNQINWDPATNQATLN